MRKQKRDCGSGPGTRLEFPPEDREWIAIQKRVIEAVKCPIEDIPPHNIEALRHLLTDAEMFALYQYQLRRSLEQVASEPILWEQITQIEIAHLSQLRANISRLQRECEWCEKAIANALLAGVAVEEGPFTIRLRKLRAITFRKAARLVVQID